MNIKDQIASYPNYLTALPETRINNALIDCTAFLLEQKPDTEETLNER